MKWKTTASSAATIVVALNKLIGICVCEDVELKTTQTSPVPRFIFSFALENLLL